MGCCVDDGDDGEEEASGGIGAVETQVSTAHAV